MLQGLGVNGMTVGSIFFLCLATLLKDLPGEDHNESTYRAIIAVYRGLPTIILSIDSLFRMKHHPLGHPLGQEKQ